MIELSQKSRIEEAISQAEMILIGVGEELSPSLPDFGVGEELRPFAVSQYYASLMEENETVMAYKKLRAMIGVKPYFAVTLNTDDLIYKGGFWQDLVVAPCGSMGKMQCSEHIVEAASVCEQVMAAVQENPDWSQAEIFEKYVRCPKCGAPLQFHVKSTEGYLEEGYLEQWKYYNNWLTCTLNRRLCVLELGVDFRYPQVIRWPFERVTYFNQNATLIRVHSRLPQVAAELGERGISVKCTPYEFINSMEYLDKMISK